MLKFARRLGLSIAPLFFACLCVIPAAHGQTVSGSGNTSSMALGRLNTTILTLQQQLNAANSNIAKLQGCSSQHMFYSPSDPKADGNGCTGEQDPQVDTLTANGLCTSDGNVVDCKAMSGTDVKVFSVTQISSNHTTATASCPAGTLRVGCGGNRDYGSTCAEGACGIASITPSGVNSCQITASGSGIVPAAVALCFSLNGGSDIVQGSVPTPPPPAPKSCALPWGGTLASGSSVTAYGAGSVACGSKCSSQTRTCNNGTLSGSYGSKTCSVNACNCAASYVSWGRGCEASVPALANGASTSVSFDDCQPCTSGGTWGSTTATCNNGVVTANGGSCMSQSCFVPGTYVLMADGSSKYIEDLKVGDKVRGHTRINTVIGLPNYDNPTPIYGFNGGKPFVTGGHPFWTAEGWKAIDPSLTPKEHHNVKTTQLKVGDVLLLENGQPFTVRSINKGRKAGPHHVFDPQVDGDHTYYANGLLVHNKRYCPKECERQYNPVY